MPPRQLSGQMSEFILLNEISVFMRSLQFGNHIRLHLSFSDYTVLWISSFFTPLFGTYLNLLIFLRTIENLSLSLSCLNMSFIVVRFPSTNSLKKNNLSIDVVSVCFLV